MNKIFNITNGDCLAEQLKETTISGEMIICREALVAGSLQAENLDVFWKVRSEFIAENYGDAKENYYRKVVSECNKMMQIPEDSEVYLWFEDDLFCQVNMWFCLTLIPKDKNINIYRIFPKASKENQWKGFSDSDRFDLEEALTSKVLFKQKDLELGLNLWEAYQSNRQNKLKQLSEIQSDCFRFLPELITVYQNINPEVFIKNLIQNGITDFSEVFEKFRDELGIFGFGDLQVKLIYDKVFQEK
ncbi:MULTISPECIES: DUF1835 domain-containing protein [unclassified Chryseobacterium]|uniref:DUF1835 domain-containing protein n=1 Tax=unclassified Chryseobacterium TaxID=2593645 RepID=UPI000D3966AE|nr:MULTISPECIES: DUF1835 domain-containing protein [unclassified Chryseobacterium]PTT77010.1 DUF1835 domain-containing protein [Chryseobacterium sp. HMWF001]PVV61746.1 DUF1835 domain-containing protein [Chryseobacterium sp. HMWF035]